MKIKILGTSWNLKYVNNLGKDVGGHCDFDGKTIRICNGLDDYNELRVIIHEILHAADYYKDEEWVDDLSRDIAIILMKKLDWIKKVEDEDNKR